MIMWRRTLVAGICAVGLVSMFLACGDDDSDGIGAAGVGANGNSGTGAQAASGGLGFGGGLGASGAGIQADGGIDGDADVCASETVSAERSRANLFFLIDRSGSMNCNLPPIQSSQECEAYPTKVDEDEPSKWEVTEQALSDAFAALENADPLPSVGIAYFNSDNYCGFPTQPDVDIVELSGDAADPHLTDLQNSLGAVAPQGYTPIVGTMMGAYNYLYSSGDSFDGLLFVVLLTDGAETCDSDNTDFLVQKSLEASWVGIRTFVLGAPGSESARAFLSQIAYNGDTPEDPNCDHSGAPADQGDCHIDMTLAPNFAQALADALERVSSEALACVFDVPTPEPGDPPVDLTKVNVKYEDSNGGEQYFLQDYNTACDDPSNMGWQYADNNTKIVLCAGACAVVQGDSGGSVVIELGCQTQVTPT